MRAGRVLIWAWTERSAPGRVSTGGHVMTLRYTPDAERLVVQTSEWVHLVELAAAPAVSASLLVPGLAQPGGLRFESDDGGRISLLLDRGPGEVEMQRLDFFNPSVAGGTDRDFGVIQDWLGRLKLRFDASGELVPTSGARPRNPVPGPPGTG